MAEAKKRKRTVWVEARGKKKKKKKKKRESDRAWHKTRVNIGPAFSQWRALMAKEGCKSDAELAMLLIERVSATSDMAGVKTLFPQRTLNTRAKSWRRTAQTDVPKREGENMKDGETEVEKWMHMHSLEGKGDACQESSTSETDIQAGRLLLLNAVILRPHPSLPPLSSTSRRPAR
ncbi:hypothetical protein GJAV_G00003240 [Gymnothorax javanicus]|nr:hypothetical protein GJAV_G00003240 [Gymnothorax javanicus]